MRAREGTGYDDHSRIEQVDHTGYRLTEGLADFLDSLDDDRVLGIGRVKYVIQSDFLSGLEFLAQKRRLTGRHLLKHNPVKSRSGCLGLKTADLSAPAYPFVVENREMAYLAGEAGTTVAQLAVDDHSETQSPAHVEHKECLLRALAGHIFSVGYGPGIILHIDRQSKFLLKDACDRLVLAYEIGKAIA